MAEKGRQAALFGQSARDGRSGDQQGRDPAVAQLAPPAAQRATLLSVQSGCGLVKAQQTVRAAADTEGTAVLLVEQHVHLALEIADRGYVLSHGEIVLHETAGTLRSDSSHLTASYLGESAV